MIKDASALSRSECFLDDEPMADWERLGRVVIARRVNLGYNTQGEFATLLGVSSRLVGDIENGRRSNYDPATIARLEQALSWETGSVDKVLEGGEPAPVRRLADAGPSDSTLVLIHRPDGPDEIDLIYASATMTAEEKLLRIRQVLQLRAQAEAHERQRQAAQERA